MRNQPSEIQVKHIVVDRSLLERQPIQRCEIGSCRAACCADGVWVDLDQSRRILEQAELIAPFLPAERRDPAGWFAEQYRDSEFPSGQCIGTTTVKDRTHPNGETCVFLRPDDRYCAIQSACLADGLPAWSLKPYYCCLFPLIDERDEDRSRKRLLLDSDNDLFERGGGCCQAGETAQPVFQVYVEETALALGLDGYRELCAQAGVEPRL